MINITATPGVRTFSLRNLSFGLVTYPTFAGLLSPKNQTMQALLHSDVPDDIHVFFNPSFRGLGLPHYAWSTFSNLMEVVTRGQFDCSTDMRNGVTYGFCISYTSCASFTNVWNYTFQIYFNGGSDSNYINVPLSTFAFDYQDEESGLQFCQIYAEYLDPYQPQS